VDDRARIIKGTVTLADGSTSEFQIMPGGNASQWGADRERLGRSVDVLAALVRGLTEESLLVGENEPEPPAAAFKVYDHEARPDDNPEPGDHCKDCGADITWIGPSQADWLHVDDERNS
jgi:hypothetical protein